MKPKPSKIIKKDRQGLLKLQRSMTPQEKLTAFYQHSRILQALSLQGRIKPLRKSPSSPRPRKS